MIASNACARTPSCGSEAEAIWSQTPSEGQITIERIARATFEDMTTEEITAWLDRHLHQRPSLGVQQVVFRTGRLAAVYGVQLTNDAQFGKQAVQMRQIEPLADLAVGESFGRQLGDLQFLRRELVPRSNGPGAPHLT